MENVNIKKYDTKTFFENHMLTTIELEMGKNPDLTRTKAEKITKNKNKRLLNELNIEVAPGISLMLSSTKFERFKNPQLSGLQAQNLAIKKNDLLIAKLQDIASNLGNKQMVIIEKVSSNHERILFSRDISYEKNEILVLLALLENKSEITIKELSKIATAFSCRLGQRKNHASSIIRKTLKAFNKGNKVFFKIQNKNKQINKLTAIQRIHKEFRKLVSQNIITNDQRKILIKIVDNIIKQEDSSYMGLLIAKSILGENTSANIMDYVTNIKKIG